MTEDADKKDDPLRPLPNTGIVPHPHDFVLRLDFMNETGMHAGYLRIKASDGNVELNGFTFLDDKLWSQLESKAVNGISVTPIVKLCRILFVTEQRANHAKRELLNAQEALVRSTEVLSGKRPVVIV